MDSSMKVQVKEDLCSEFYGASCEVVGEFTANDLEWTATIWSGGGCNRLGVDPSQVPSPNKKVGPNGHHNL